MSHKYDFTGKVALVTGSSSGIGAAIAIQLAQYGARVTITGRNAANLQKIANKIEQQTGGQKPHQIIDDLISDSFPKKLIDETVEKFGRLDILVNNAGGAVPDGTLAKFHWQNMLKVFDQASNGGCVLRMMMMMMFDQAINLNVRSVVALTQLSVPHLEKTKGNVINISSVTSVVGNMNVYSLAKAALDNVQWTWSHKLLHWNWVQKEFDPGPVVTSFGRSLGFTEESYAPFFSEFTEASLMKRIGQPEDIANLVSFLASDDARNITGSIYLSDSGWAIYEGTKVPKKNQKFYLFF